jgi:hypothetical protein
MSYHHRPFRTVEQHAADILAMRHLAFGEPHLGDCECGSCLADYACDVPPDMGDEHEPWLHDPGDRVFDWRDE